MSDPDGRQTSERETVCSVVHLFHSLSQRDSHSTALVTSKDPWANFSPKLHSFQVHSEACDFHFNMSKRSVTFRLTHFDIKPQITIWRNAFLGCFTCFSFNNEDVPCQRLWQQHEACFSDGAKTTEGQQEVRPRLHTASENPINGKTLHKGPVAHVVVI